MSNELEKLSTAALCDEIERLDAKATRGQWKAGQHDPYSLMAWEGSQRSNLAVFDPGNAYTGDVELCARYRALAPEAARLRVHGRALAGGIAPAAAVRSPQEYRAAN